MGQELIEGNFSITFFLYNRDYAVVHFAMQAEIAM
jgi:hypothetical protein